MNTLLRISLALVLLVGLGTVSVYLYQPEITQPISSVDSGASKDQRAAPTINGSKVISHTRAERAAPIGVPIASVSRQHVRRAIAEQTNFATLRQHILTHPEIDERDKNYIAAVIDDYCFTSMNTSEAARAPVRIIGTTIGMGAPAPNLALGSGTAAERARAKLALQERRPASQCSELGNITWERVMSGWEIAAKSGDLRAKAILADLELRIELRPLEHINSLLPNSQANFKMQVPKDPDAVFVKAITDALATGDPSAIVSLAPVLMQRYETQAFSFGTGQEVLTRGTRHALWQVVACDLGARCNDHDNEWLMRACSDQGQCALTVEQYLRRYQLTQEDIEQLDRLRPQIHEAIRTNQWNRVLHLSPARGSTFLIIPGRYASSLG
jgi:hypothetical protein